MEITSDIFYLAIIIATGVVYVLGGFFASRIIAPHYPDSVKNAPYECGEIPHGSAWTRFNVGYYIFALLFLIFEIEVVFFFPWAVVLKEVGISALISGGVFLFILLFGFVFAWRKGYFIWH